MRDVTAMWQEIVDIKNKIEAEEQKGGEGNPNLLDQWRQEVKDLEDLIADIEKAEREQTIETKAQTESIAFNVAGVDMTSLPSEVIQLVEIIVKNDRKRIYAEEMAKMDEFQETHKAILESVTAQEELTRKNYHEAMSNLGDVVKDKDRAYASYNETLNELVKTKEDLEDHKERLDNAAFMLDEKDDEIKRLNSEISDMRATATYGEKTAQNIIDVTPESVTEVQGLVDAIAKKYIKSEPIGSGNYHEVTAADGTKEVVHKSELPSIETQQEQPFQPNEADTSNAGNVQNMATYEAPPVAGPQFPTTTGVGPIAIPMVNGPSSSDRESGETPATQEWVKAQLAELEARITGEKAA